MMKTFDIVIEQQSGRYRASVLALPQIVVEAASREEAIANLRAAIEKFFATAELMTIAVAAPAYETDSYSSSADLQRWLDIYLPPVGEPSGEHGASQYPLAEKWAAKTGIPFEDPRDSDHRAFLMALAIDKQRQREEAEREADAIEAALKLAQTAQ